MTKKKIGILNFQYSTHNYGAVLQAAALEHILKAEGHDVEHIDFAPLPKKLTFKGRVKKLCPRITTPEQFSTLAKKYDTVVVGSDQVWRPRMTVDPEAFFLSYVPAGVDRIN